MNRQNCNDLLLSLENLQDFPKKIVTENETKKIVPEITTTRKGPTFYNCSAFGNIPANCPQPLKKSKCYTCHKIGHNAAKSNVAEEVWLSRCPLVMKEVDMNGEKFS